MSWAWDNRGPLGTMLTEHLFMAFVPLLLGLAVALPLALVVARAPIPRNSALGVCAVVESIPVLAWFVFLPAVLGTTLDASANVMVGLTVMVVAMLTRTIYAALRAVPEQVQITADAVGFSPMERVRGVDLPLAVPAVIAGLRSASVACVTLVTLAALVGAGGLGRTLIEGFAGGSEAEVVSGMAVVVVLGLAAEAVLVRMQRMFAPWSQLAPVR
jgi:osmoprotectant transport system permease protein